MEAETKFKKIDTTYSIYPRSDNLILKLSDEQKLCAWIPKIPIESTLFAFLEGKPRKVNSFMEKPILMS